MAFKMKGMNHGEGTGSALPKTGSPMKVVPLAAAGLTAVRALATRGARKVAKKQLPKVINKLSKTKGGKKVIEKLDVGKTLMQKGKDFLKSKTGKATMLAATVAPTLMGSKKAPIEKKQPAKPKPKSKSYAQAYKDRDMKTYGKLSLDEYTKEAKRQKAVHAKTGKWDYKGAPKKETTTKGKKSTTTVKAAGYTKTTTDKKRGTTIGSKKTTTTTNKITGVKTKKKEKTASKFEGPKEKTTTITPTTVTKGKRKSGKDRVLGTGDDKIKTKSRKRGGTGLGAAIKGAIAKRKARRTKRREERNSPLTIYSKPKGERTKY